MTSGKNTQKDEPSLEVLSELCRHYDTTLWAVTSLWAAAIGGLLIYSTEAAHFDMRLSVFGMTLTGFAFFFAASFRKANAQVQEKMPEEIRSLFRSPSGFRQWNGFLLIFLSLDGLWVMVLTKNMPEWTVIWDMLGTIVGSTILFYWNAAQGKGNSDGVNTPPPKRRWLQSVGRIEQSEIRRNSSSTEGKSGGRRTKAEIQPRNGGKGGRWRQNGQG